jgi:uncharacterized protein (DUF952 family)
MVRLRSKKGRVMELCHVLTESAWTRAQADGEVALPLGETFLHCCTQAQLDFVLRRHFSGVTGLVVLTFEPTDVKALLLWENSEPDQLPFPHLFGSIPCAAVRRVAHVA